MERIVLPKKVECLLQRLNQNGYEAYVVGGCVRDSIMGITPNDWDICTSARPEKIMEIFADLRVIPTGLKHGTITVVIDEEQFEITTFRIDGEYIDNRRPENVEFVNDLRLDLMRRDFTINALAYNHECGIIDYFGGINDIQNGIIKSVGNANDRFNEDALRILRAVRFAARFGFSIDTETRKAMLGNSGLLRNISAERINAETVKTLMCGFCAKESNFLDLISLLSEIVVGLKRLDGAGVAKRLSEAPLILEVRLALLFDFDEDELKYELKHLKFPNDISNSVLVVNKHGKSIKDHVIALINCDNSVSGKQSNKKDRSTRALQKVYSTRRLLSEIGYDLSIMSVEYALSFFNSDDEEWSELVDIESRVGTYAADGKPCKISDLDINGNDLIGIGYAGKNIGKVLNALLDMTFRDVIENKRTILLGVASAIEEWLL